MVVSEVTDEHKIGRGCRALGGPGCVLFAVQQGFAARYLLRTEILRTVEASGAKVVILTPNPDEAYLREEFGRENVCIEKFRVEENEKYLKGSRIQQFFQHVRLLVLSDKGDLEGIRRREARERVKYAGWKQRLFFTLVHLTALILRRSSLLRRSLIWLEGRVFTPAFHDDIFARHKPFLVVVPSLGYWPDDALLMREAQRHGAKVVSVILSWDNPSSKGMAGAKADYVVAWTENMKRELVTYHDLDPDRIFVGGVAHFDLHFAGKCPLEWSLLRQYLNLESDRRLIVFGTASPTVYREFNLEVVRVLGAAIAQDRFVKPCQILVRVHPLYLGRPVRRADKSTIEELQRVASSFPHVVLDLPESRSEKLGFDLALSDMHKLRVILENASALVSLFSTLMLEASIFDVPIVNVAFDQFNEKLQDTYSARAKEPHIRRILETGGTRTANSSEELVKLINRYLADTALDAEGRLRIRINECGPKPGSAGRSIGNYIVRLLEEEIRES